MRGFLALVTALAAVQMLSARPVRAEVVERFCSVFPTPLRPDPLDSYFMGQATARTLPASAGSIEPSDDGGYEPPGPAGDPTWGQVFVIQAVGGVESSRLFDSREIVVVTW